MEGFHERLFCILLLSLSSVFASFDCSIENEAISFKIEETVIENVIDMMQARADYLGIGIEENSIKFTLERKEDVSDRGYFHDFDFIIRGSFKTERGSLIKLVGPSNSYFSNGDDNGVYKEDKGIFLKYSTKSLLSRDTDSNRLVHICRTFSSSIFDNFSLINTSFGNSVIDNGFTSEIVGSGNYFDFVIEI